MSKEIIHVNSRGFGEDINRLASRRPLAIVLTEHKRANVKDLDTVKGYNLASAYPANTSQRGVAVYVRNRVKFEPKPRLNAFAEEGHFEAATVDIPSKKLLVTGVYRSPNSSKTDFNESLQDTIASARRVAGGGRRHVVAGDINIDSRRNSNTQRVVRENGYKLNVHKSTHESGGCLDNFITNFNPSKTRVLRAGKDQVRSDHNPISMLL